ncbi:hypothetical protein G7K_5357-t1 [Saitoella complicata NRRL Y-17804]|uniref:3-oxoacyl-[acyl-carrier-protein] reductase n=1 Tax=Saitoella complicata (strain BCRC 22490 / CBS 7301 / JCM 7358 / NBRC 10748 / NRRL Y-17804) TaxID=698492 RepID=A0A0E9NP94_SAICN|nr:hypothetical protein G7K_5357-t1 [Saitoella complicata NRRL Y-17804]
MVLVTDFKDKLALITGATGGIGYATCLALAGLGCDIAVHYNSAAEKAQTLVAALREKGVKAECFQADLRSYDEVRRLHKEVVEKMGHPAILFNNAGITIKHGIKSIEEVDMDMFEQTWRANCGSAFLLTQLCIPEMEKKAWGRVIFCASVAGFIGGFVGPHYASSKSALHGLVHWLSQHYAHKGITVNAVAPALIADTTLLPGNPEDLAKKIPVGVLGRPEEIAETVVWMVKTGYLTNKVVGVDGGMFPQ